MAFSKRDFLSLLVSGVVAAPTAAIVAKTVEATPYHPAETAYERVCRTKRLRCGYGLWEPGMSRDLKTGQLKGIFHDYLLAIGRHTGLTIEFTEEIGWGDYPAALNSGRIDAMCFGAWPKATLATEVIFTKPTYYLPVYAYVRANDSRFDSAPEKINTPAVTISTMDAELSSELALSQFPQARTLSVPQMSPAGTLLLNVATGKADITFTDAWTGAVFMQANPDKLKVLPMKRPLRLFGHTIPVARGEDLLANMLDVATDEIMSTGEFESIVANYATVPGVLLMKQDTFS